MSHSPDPWGPVSGAPLDLGPEPTDADRLVVPEDERYEPGPLLGAGGMGVVHRAFDVRLQRPVALKRMRSARSDERFLREAELTARLEHPGIVPVYSAGRTPDGSPYYTMRLASGRSLADALPSAPHLADRLALLRPFVSLCQAMAYAHEQGILHRDLKPRNLQLGEFGEAWVVDWGLACELDSDEARQGARVGSPGYLSPEQAAGRPIDPRSDLYALGVVLGEILSGVPEPVPQELSAIVRRATAPDPDDRYPDARALAADIEAWFEGRRVAAHAYSSWELGLRLARAWRAPLAVAGVATVALLALALSASLRTAAERDRAERSLASSLVAQARSAERAGQRFEGEVLAVEALRLGDSPDARGVLLAFASRPRPTRVARFELPAPCRKGAASPDGQSVACTTMGGAYRVDLSSGQVDRTSHAAQEVGFELGTHRVVLLSDPLDLEVWDGAADPRRLRRSLRAVAPTPSSRGGEVVVAGQGGHVVVDLETGAERLGPGCGARGPNLARHHATGAVALVCSDLRLAVVRDDDRIEAALPFAGPSDLAFSGDGARVGVAAADGRVAVFDASSAALLAVVDTGPDAVTRLVLDPAGVHLAVSTAGAGVTVWDVASGALLASLPGDPRALSWRTDGVLRLVGATAVEDWAVEAGGRAAVLPSDDGVASVAWDRDGARIATAHGSGEVLLRDARTGDVLGRRHLAGEGVAKDVAFSPDGRWLAAVAATEARQLEVLSLPDLEEAFIFPGEKYRRVAWQGDRVLALPYAQDALWFELPDRVGELSLGAAGLDLDVDGGIAGVRTFDDHLWRVLRDGAADLGVFPGVRTVAVHGDEVWFSTRTSISRVGGAPFETDAAEILDLAISPDGQTLATAHLDATTRLWDRDGTLLAVLRGHEAQVARVVFSTDGRWLATGSWDGDVRQWSLEPLRAPVGDVAEAVARQWGHGLEEVLSEAR